MTSPTKEPSPKVLAAPKHRFSIEVEAAADTEIVQEFISQWLANNFGGVSTIKPEAAANSSITDALAAKLVAIADNHGMDFHSGNQYLEAKDSLSFSRGYEAGLRYSAALIRTEQSKAEGEKAE